MTAQKRAPKPHLALNWLPQPKPPTTEASSRCSVKPTQYAHNVEALLLIILAGLSCCEPPPFPIRCSPPPRPVRKRLRLVIGQFTIDVASAQAGFSQAQHPLKHLPLRSFFAPTSADTP